MGFVTSAERSERFSTYGPHAQDMRYVCDNPECCQPIYGTQLMTVDPKGGYHKKPEKTPAFLPKEPKRTFHYECAPGRAEKRAKEEQKASRESGEPTARKERQQAPQGRAKATKTVVTQASENKEHKEIPFTAADYKRVLARVTELVESKRNKPFYTISLALRTMKAEGEYKPRARCIIREMRRKGDILREGKFLLLPKKG